MLATKKTMRCDAKSVEEFLLKVKYKVVFRKQAVMVVEAPPIFTKRRTSMPELTGIYLT
jgi:hypothetical protein